MSRLTRLTILLALVVVVVLSAGPVWAKGGSYLRFDRLYYHPGESLKLETEFRTDVIGWQPGSVEDGPYFAYLLPLARRIPYIDPPHIPKGAVPLGPLVIQPGSHEEEWLASVSFVVPDVPPGEYWLDICNDPCRHSSVGDLGGGSFQVAANAEEAHLMNLLHEWVSDMIDERVPPVAVVEGDLTTLRVSEALRDTRTRLDLARGLRDIQDDVAALRDQSEDAAASSSGLESALWLIGWLVAAGIGGLWWASSRRRRSPVRARPASV
jgi:hypothetical protein